MDIRDECIRHYRKAGYSSYRNVYRSGILHSVYWHTGNTWNANEDRTRTHLDRLVQWIDDSVDRMRHRIDRNKVNRVAYWSSHREHIVVRPMADHIGNNRSVLYGKYNLQRLYIPWWRLIHRKLYNGVYSVWWLNHVHNRLDHHGKNRPNRRVIHGIRHIWNRLDARIFPFRLEQL